MDNSFLEILPYIPQKKINNLAKQASMTISKFSWSGSQVSNRNNELIEPFALEKAFALPAETILGFLTGSINLKLIFIAFLVLKNFKNNVQQIFKKVLKFSTPVKDYHNKPWKNFFKAKALDVYKDKKSS